MTTKIRSTRVYRFGCRGPIEGADVVFDQLRRAHTYRNRLVEIERTKRGTIRQALDTIADVAPLVEERDRLVAELERVRAAHKASKQAKRKESVSTLASEKSALTAALKAARASLAAARMARKDDPGARRIIEEAERKAKADAKAAPAECGVYWGTYLQVNRAHAAACAPPKRKKTPPKTPLAPWHLRPAFVRWSGEGCVAVQLQNGCSMERLCSGRDRQVHLGPVDPTLVRGPLQREEGSRRCDSSRGVGPRLLRLRVASEGRDPVWASFVVFVHREIPPDCSVKWVVITRQRVGTIYHWAVHFTVEHDLELPRVHALPTVALNFGWRRMSTGCAGAFELRIAYAVLGGADGPREELRLPSDLVAKMEHARSILSLRDKLFDAFHPRAVEMAKALRASADVPEWFAHAEDTLFKWKSADRLWRFVMRWRGSRFDGDADVFARRPEWMACYRDWLQHRDGPRPEPVTFDEWAWIDLCLSGWRK